MSTDITHILFGYSNTDSWAFTQGMTDSAGFAPDEIWNAPWGGGWTAMTTFTTAAGGKTRNYVLGTGSSDKQLFIQGVTDYGALSYETYRGYQNCAFNVCCSYTTSGGVFVFLHDTGTHKFEIHSISSDGKLNPTPVQTGTWGDGYGSVFAVNVSGNLYLGGHTSSKNKFFLQPIKADGSLADNESYSTNWSNYYQTLTTISVGGHVYLFGQTTNKNHWFTQEILSTGKLSNSEAASGEWGNFYQTATAFTLGGTTYFMGQSKDQNKHWFIQAVGSDGKFAAAETASGSFGNFYAFFSVMTTPPLRPVDNWMTGVYDSLLKTRTLKQIIMPGAHDAGMSSSTECSLFGNASNTKTQGGTVLQQLNNGCRFFDLRPIACLSGSDCTYRTGHFSNIAVLGYQGCFGESVDQVLNDVISYAAVPGRDKELIILKFSHYMTMMNGGFTDGWDDGRMAGFANYVVGRLGSLLIRYAGPGLVGGLTYEQLMGCAAAGSPKVLFVMDGIQAPARNQAGGVFRYADYPSPGNGDLNVYDHYADSTDLGPMVDDQYKKLTTPANHGGDMFYLAWTLTQTGAADPAISTLASKADGVVAGDLTQWTDQGNITAALLPNVISVDFVTGLEAALSRALMEKIYLNK
jgi:hypothetical protein